MPDGSSPSQTLKKKLLDILNFLPVTEEHLKSCKIGKLLYDMQKNPRIFNNSTLYHVNLLKKRIQQQKNK